MSQLFLIVGMLVAGAAIAIQPPINARLAEKTGFLQASTISFAVGTMVLLILSLLSRQGSFKRVFEAEWWQVTGGLYGAFLVTMVMIAVPRIGVTAMLGLTIVSQLAAGVVMDHYGLLGMPQIPVDFKRMLGIALLLVGVYLVMKR